MRTLNSSRLGLEASSGDILEAEAGAAPAGGLVTRTRATSGHYGPTSVERPRWSAERRASRSQGARDASQASPMRASQARTIRACSALRSLLGSRESGAAPCAEGRKIASRDQRSVGYFPRAV